MALFLRSNSTFTNPIKDTPVLPAQPFTSDAFNRADSSTLGRLTDAGLGGTRQEWLGTAGVFGISGRRAVVQPHTGVFFVGLAAPVPDYMVSFTIQALPTVESVYLDVRRPLAATTPTQDGIRLAISSNTVTVAKRVSVVATMLGQPQNYALGSTVALRVKGTTAQLLIDGVLKETHTITDASLQGAGHAGFSGSAGLASFAFDDFTISPA